MEIFTPDPDGTLWFFKELLGMQETVREGQSVYLRAYEDFYHHTLKVTERNEPGLGHVSWRASSKEALERRVKELEKSGAGKGWMRETLAMVQHINSLLLTTITWKFFGMLIISNQKKVNSLY